MRKLGAAEMTHEAAEPVVPVVVPGKSVDPVRIAAVGPEELVDVLVRVADRIDHVAHRDEEARVRAHLEQAGDDRELRMRALAGVAGDEKREALDRKST